ncbi:MAG: DUF3147 family protein [Methylophilaceae bacterium]
MLIIIKLVVTSAIIVLISEIAKHYDRLAALIASLPLVTLITLFWLYYEDQSDEKLASHAYYTFWYVLPTLPMFLFFPWGIKVFGFWITFILSIFLTVILFVIYAMLLKKFGIDLL